MFTVYECFTEESNLRSQKKVREDLLVWYELHKVPDKPAVGVFGESCPVAEIFKKFNIPVVNLKFFGLCELQDLPIGIIYVMSPGDMYSNWCRDHNFG